MCEETPAKDGEPQDSVGVGASCAFKLPKGLAHGTQGRKNSKWPWTSPQQHWSRFQTPGGVILTSH